MRYGTDEFRQRQIEKYIKRTKEAIEQKGLCSYMNNTKWNNLIVSLEQLPFKPPYQFKSVLNNPEPEHFDKDVNYLGDWSDEVLYPYKAIEWLRVRPRYIKHQGMLIEDKVFDITEDFISILRDLDIYYELKNESVYIFGYK